MRQVRFMGPGLVGIQQSGRTFWLVPLGQKVGVCAIYEAVHQAGLKGAILALSSPGSRTTLAMVYDRCGGPGGCAQTTVSNTLPVLAIAFEMALPGAIRIDRGGVEDLCIDLRIAQGGSIRRCAGRVIGSIDGAEVLGLTASIICAKKSYGLCFNTFRKGRFPGRRDE